MKVFTLEVKPDKRCCLRVCRTIKLDPNACINTPQKVANFMNKNFKANCLAEEHIWILGFDTAMHPISAFELSHGICNEALASPREVFIRLLLCGAVSWIMVHNHPSGAVRPSAMDNIITSRMVTASELLNIKLLDHIIIGEEYYSFAQDDKLTQNETERNYNILLK